MLNRTLHLFSFTFFQRHMCAVPKKMDFLPIELGAIGILQQYTHGTLAITNECYKPLHEWMACHIQCSIYFYRVDQVFERVDQVLAIV